MKDLSRLLNDERKLEERLAAGWANDNLRRDWSPRLIFFHVAQWRTRLVEALSNHEKGQPFSAPPGNIDEFNDAELPGGRRMQLPEAASRSNATLGSLVELWRKLGDRPFAWYSAETVSEALTRNGYLHPRIHLASYLMDRGDRVEGDRMVEETAVELRAADAHARVLGAALYNLANVRVTQGRNVDAIELLEEAAPMRPDLGSYAIEDTAFEALRDSPRIRALGKKGPPGQSA